MSGKWNANPAAFANKLGSYVDRKAAFQNVAVYTLVAAAAAAVSQYGYDLFHTDQLLLAMTTMADTMMPWIALQAASVVLAPGPARSCNW